MSRFTVSNLPLAGLKLVERQRISDSRGFLSRLFCAEELAAAGWVKPITQINHTYTAMRGTVRGMHFQRPPHAEMKLVTCIRGEIWGVAVDMRADSPTFLHWHAERLSADTHGDLEGVEPRAPSSHPHKYRLAYLENGKRVIGFDNERGKGDHRHEGDSEYSYTFQDVTRLIQDFIDAVKQRRSPCEH